MQVFENEEFGEVRTLIEDGGTVLFGGTDVAKVFGYTNPRKAVRDHCKGRVICTVPTVSGNQDVLFITELDIYRLIMRSKLPAAMKFEKWVVEDVLPTIRKNGAYITPEKLNEITANQGCALGLLSKVQQQENQMAQMQPKADYYDALVEHGLLTGIRNTAKELKLPEKLFTFLLVDMKFAYRTPKKQLMPYAFMVNMGYAELREFTRNGHGGVQLMFTPKGRLYLMTRIQKRLARKMLDEPSDMA